MQLEPYTKYPSEVGKGTFTFLRCVTKTYQPSTDWRVYLAQRQPRAVYTCNYNNTVTTEHLLESQRAQNITKEFDQFERNTFTRERFHQNLCQRINK